MISTVPSSNKCLMNVDYHKSFSFSASHTMYNNTLENFFPHPILSAIHKIMIIHILLLLVLLFLLLGLNL